LQLDEWVLCKVYQKSKKKKDENEENIKTITPSVDGRVPAVKCATSQPEGSNSLGVNGNHSDQVSFTNQVIPANSDMEMGHMNIIPPIDPRERTHVQSLSSTNILSPINCKLFLTPIWKWHI